MEDIKSLDDIKEFVDAFYTKIQTDELLAPPFASRIAEGDWPRHLNRMYSFWNTVLFSQKGYSGNPAAKHIGLNVDGKHFKQWVHLFEETIDERFSGPVATDAKSRAAKMALLFKSKLEYIANNPGHTPII